MTWRSLIWRGVRFHARAHLGVLLGAVIATAALAGALILGDSVRASLRAAALARLGATQFALSTGDRFFESRLGSRMAGPRTPGAGPAAVHPENAHLTTALRLPGLVTVSEADRTAPRVQVLGVDPQTWPEFAKWQASLANGAPWLAGNEVFINEPLAAQLQAKPGDQVLVRVRKPGLLADDAAITPKDEHSVVLRLRVGRVLSEGELGVFNLHSGRPGQPNAFLPLNVLADAVGQTNRANLLLVAIPNDRETSPPDVTTLQRALESAWRPEDASLVIRILPAADSRPAQVEVASSRIFLESAVVEALAPRTPGAGLEKPRPVLTYLANLLQLGERSVPYSMVTAAGAPELVPADLRDEEIILNDWLARELQARPGGVVALSYYVVESGASLVERTNLFRVRSIVPMTGPCADRTLMPEFPGIARAESTHDWDTGFPLRYPIRPADETYWKQYRGTPKAFVTLRAGQQMWGNRFGSLTALRFSVPPGSSPEAIAGTLRGQLQANLPPAAFGLRLVDVRSQALQAAAQAQDFAQLFLAFSFFLVISALLLMALLFRFALEQRTGEVGLLLAVGFKSSQVARLLLGEGLVLGLIGGLLGSALGVAYARLLLLGLRTIWREAAGGLHLGIHLQPITLLASAVAGLVIALVTIALSLRGFTRRPARELLAGDLSSPSPGASRLAWWVAAGAGMAAVALMGSASARTGPAQAPTFFGAGALLLISGLASASAWLSRMSSQAACDRLSLRRLAVRGCGRRHGRSLAAIALLACGTFMIVGPSAFRLDATDDTAPGSGTGGFRLLGETAMPVVQDLNTPAGRDFFNLESNLMHGVAFVPLRVREGDEASCLNLSRAQRPRLLGVDPAQFAGRFTFVAPKASAGWELLRAPSETNSTSQVAPLPAIGDANAIQWAMGKKIGDLIDYADEQGRPFQVRIVGAVANSILQGSLVIDEAAFLQRFPSSSGARMFLVSAPAGRTAGLSTALLRSLEDHGVELTSTTARLNEFNAVQNTYLATFQVLGGLGLLLGSAGLGIVVLRNVFERRAELAVLTAVGLPRRTLSALVLIEHAFLLLAGLGLGTVAAGVAVLPALMQGATSLPVAFLSVTLMAVLLNGLLWTWLAARAALRSPLLAALRNE